jgi:hypothetical protein
MAMRASKESAEHAQKMFEQLMVRFGIPAPAGSGVEHIRDFLDAARRKLPTEAAYKRDRSRAR